MTLHLIKLCVGAESVEDLAEWHDQGHADWKGPKGKRAVAHLTFQTPKRVEELTESGSLYWVIKGRVLVRQRILAIESANAEGGKKRCAIVMDPALILTRPFPHRAFQGWRYLDPSGAPADIGSYGRGDGEGSARIKAELLELGLL